nr:hypothetical protein [Thauera sp.]
RVVLDLPVDLPRPRDAASPAVDRLYQALLARHPELLGGLASGARGIERNGAAARGAPATGSGMSASDTMGRTPGRAVE